MSGDLAHPYRIDGRGRTAETDPETHVGDLIRSVLFTAPGERVNRPTFGSGLHQSLFRGTDDAVAAATRFQVQASLQQWLGDVIRVEEVHVASEDSELVVTLRYTVLRNDRSEVASFRRSG